jgi:inner membrane protein
MMARSHVVIGLATWIAAAPLLHVASLDPVHLCFAVAGSLLPDMDHPKSWVGRRSRPVSTLIASVLGHRGITHSALAVVGLVMLLTHAGFRGGVVSALAVGYLSHLAADMLTPQGLRLAWPLPWTWGLPLCRTGSRMEPVVVTALVGGLAWWTLTHGGGGPALIQHWARHGQG